MLGLRRAGEAGQHAIASLDRSGGTDHAGFRHGRRSSSASCAAKPGWMPLVPRSRSRDTASMPDALLRASPNALLMVALIKPAQFDHRRNRAEDSADRGDRGSRGHSRPRPMAPPIRQQTSYPTASACKEAIARGADAFGLDHCGRNHRRAGMTGRDRPIGVVEVKGQQAQRRLFSSAAQCRSIAAGLANRRGWTALHASRRAMAALHRRRLLSDANTRGERREFPMKIEQAPAQQAPRPAPAGRRTRPCRTADSASVAFDGVGRWDRACAASSR